MAHLGRGTAPNNDDYQSSQQEYSTNTTRAVCPDPADAPEVLLSSIPPHSRGENQPQMMGTDWQQTSEPAMLSYYDPKIGTYPESVPMQQYYYNKNDSHLEAVPGQSVPAVTSSPASSDKHGLQPRVHELGISPYQGSGDESDQVVEKPEKQSNRVLGLPVAIFWTLLAFIVLAAVGLGVGLGVSLTARNVGHPGPNNGPPPLASTGPRESPGNIQQGGAGPMTTSNTTTLSGTTTSSGPRPTQSFVTSGTRGLAANSCNFDGSREYERGSSKFEAICSVDWPQGVGEAGGNGFVKDLKRELVYTFEDCMGKCVDYNSLQLATKCVAVTYNANLTDFFPKFGGNCFLKDRRGLNYPGSDRSACAALL